MPETSLKRSIQILFLFWLIIAALYYASEFLIPIAFAGILSMLLLPIVHKLEKRKLAKGIAVLLAVFLLIVIVAGLIALLSWQVSGLAEDLGQIGERLKGMQASIQQMISTKFGISAEEQKKIIEKQQESGSGSMQGVATGIVSMIMASIVNIILVLVYIFLFLYFRNHLKKFILRLSPDDQQGEAKRIIHEASKVGQQYVTGLGIMIGILWVLYGIGFSVVGVKNALFFAVLCGMLEIIPFIGNVTGTAITLLMVITQGGDSSMIIGVLITYALVQFIQTYILEPLVVGAEVNINPLFTILALVLGELIWGIPGMVLAIPLLGIIKVFCDHIPALKPYGFLIGENKKKEKKPGSIIDKIKQKFK